MHKIRTLPSHRSLPLCTLPLPSFAPSSHPPPPVILPIPPFSLLRRLSPSPHASRPLILPRPSPCPSSRSPPLRILTFHYIASHQMDALESRSTGKSNPPVIPPQIPLSAFLPFILPYSAFSHFTASHRIRWMDALESKLLSPLSGASPSPLIPPFPAFSPPPHPHISLHRIEQKHWQEQSSANSSPNSPLRIPPLHSPLLRVLTWMHWHRCIASDGCPGEQRHWQEQSSPNFSPSSPLRIPSLNPFPASSHFTASHQMDALESRGTGKSSPGGTRKGRPRPVVFMSFSGGYKACQWKIMEVRQNSGGVVVFPVSKIRECTPALLTAPCAVPLAVSHAVPHPFSLTFIVSIDIVFDSSPVDFTSDLGVRFLSRPPPVTAQPPPTPQPSATSQPPLTPQSVGSAPASAASPATTPAPTAAPKQPGSVRHTLVRSAAVVLDWLLLPEFERQRAAQWTALLHCSVRDSLPLARVLLLCSTDDQLAPIGFIRQYEREAAARGTARPSLRLLLHPHTPSVIPHPLCLIGLPAPPPAPGAGAAAVQHGRPAGTH
ncbi:unnamed protein product [Closterium sp. NIES-65]|nr:unnamed protein product [Closterium sp. NIES-65]